MLKTWPPGKPFLQRATNHLWQKLTTSLFSMNIFFDADRFRLEQSFPFNFFSAGGCCWNLFHEMRERQLSDFSKSPPSEIFSQIQFKSWDWKWRFAEQGLKPWKNRMLSLGRKSSQETMRNGWFTNLGFSLIFHLNWGALSHSATAPDKGC